MNKIDKVIPILLTKPDIKQYAVSFNRDACFEMCKDCLNIIKKAHPDFDYIYLQANKGGDIYFRLDAERYPAAYIRAMGPSLDRLEVLVSWDEMQLPENILAGTDVFPDALSDADRVRIMKLIIRHIWDIYKDRLETHKRAARAKLGF